MNAVLQAAERRHDNDERALAERNRRTALWLVAWIAFLVVVSIIVIWVRN